MTETRSGPVIIGYDDSPAADHALHEAAHLLEGREAFVVVVWEAGRAFEIASSTASLGPPPVNVDIRSALEVDRALYESAERLAQAGAVHARHLGLKAEGLAVADEVTVADTLLRLAGENDSQAIVVGNTTRRAITEILVGSTTRALLRRATCPVVVVRAPVDGEHGS
jgi:nucleotide-binding universal stress UspA family protein